MMKKIKSISPAYFIFAVVIVALVTFFSTHHKNSGRWLASSVGINCAEMITDFLRHPYYTKRYFATNGGDFAPAEPKVAREVQQAFMEKKKGGSFHKKLDPESVRRVKGSDFTHNMAKMTKKVLAKLRLDGIKKINSLAIVTSAAGLWSRGGGAVKALIPYNLKKLVGGAFSNISFGGKIFAAKTNADVLIMSRLKRVTSGLEDAVGSIFTSQMKKLIKDGDKNSTEALITTLQSLKKSELEELAGKIQQDANSYFKSALETVSNKLEDPKILREIQDSLTEELAAIQAAKLDQAKIFEIIDWMRGMDSGMSNKIASTIKNDQKEIVSGLISKVQYDSSALNAVDMKFINAAKLSQKGNTYVPLDFWTSEQTHGQVDSYVKWLKQNFRTKIFSEDLEQDRLIKDSLEAYFGKGRKLGETNIFGYQRGLHAIEVESGEFLENTPRIGKGAGDIVRYLSESGRREELIALGKKDFVFENIEVISDYAPLYELYRQGNKKVGVVLVPQKPGYKGGSPFWVRNDKGEWDLKLLEMSALDEQFAKGNDYFNSNTIFVDLEVTQIDNVAFELKDQNLIARFKLNMGDATTENEAVGILGRCGQDEIFVEYENYKSMDDYGRNGMWHIRVFLNNVKEYDDPYYTMF